MKYILTLLVLLFAFSNDATAGCTAIGATGSATCEVEGEAQAWVREESNQIQGCIATANTSSIDTQNPTYARTASTFTASFQCYVADYGWIGTHGNISATFETLCEDVEPINVYSGVSGTITCSYDNCQKMRVETAEVGVYELIPTGATCKTPNQMPPDECPAGWISAPAGLEIVCYPPPPDTDGDGHPDNEDDFPNDPAEHNDADGDGVGDNGDALPNNPNETEDSDDDGVGDNGDIDDEDPNNGQDSGVGNETDNASSGGGDCATPPESTGDAILAAIAYQTWATRCAVKELDDSSSGGNGNEQPEWTKVNGMTGDGTQGASAGDTNIFSEIGIDFNQIIDRGGFLSHSCPQLPMLDLGTFGTYTPDSENWCRLIEMLASLNVFMAGIAAARILMR